MITHAGIRWKSGLSFHGKFVYYAGRIAEILNVRGGSSHAQIAETCVMLKSSIVLNLARTLLSVELT